MPNVFDIKRNDECICGSGKKYKKCCLPRIEEIETELIKELEKDFDINQYGKDFIRVVSVMFGFEMKEDAGEADTERIAKIISELWEENDLDLDSIQKSAEAIFQLVSSKEELKFFRIPAKVFIENDTDNFDDLFDEVLEDLSIEEYLLELASIIRTSFFTDDELKTIFNWISLGLADPWQTGFFDVLFQISLKEMGEAAEKFHQIAKNEPDDSSEDAFSQLEPLFKEYPIFEEFVGIKALYNFESELDYLLNNGVEFEFPFYIIYTLFLKFLSAINEVIKEDLAYLKLYCPDLTFSAANAVLQEEEVIEEVYKDILKALSETLEENKDKNEELCYVIVSITSFFFMPLWTHIIAIEKILALSMQKYFMKLPRTVDDSQLTLNSAKQLVNREFLNNYISYLNSKGLEKEASILQKTYEEATSQDAIKEIDIEEIIDIITDEDMTFEIEL